MIHVHIILVTLSDLVTELIDDRLPKHREIVSLMSIISKFSADLSKSVRFLKM